MIRDILRFNAAAEAVMESAGDLTVDALVGELGLGMRFRNHFLLPICGAIWSTPTRRIGDFPAQALVRFMRNHALMSKGGQHQWWTVSGGSVAYVQRLVAELGLRGVALRPGTPVKSVARAGGGVTVAVNGGLPQRYDHVVFASHTDQTLAMLSDATADERKALGAIRFEPNRATLHHDPAVMPKRRRCWSSWVYRGSAADAADKTVSVTYWMNRLQNITSEDPLFATLNVGAAIPDEAIYDEVTFHHPVFDRKALDAQAAIAAMQGRRGTWFAGAWLRNGFHEDGFASAVRVARGLLPQRVAP